MVTYRQTNRQTDKRGVTESLVNPIKRDKSELISNNLITSLSMTKSTCTCDLPD